MVRGDVALKIIIHQNIIRGWKEKSRRKLRRKSRREGVLIFLWLYHGVLAAHSLVGGGMCL